MSNDLVLIVDFGSQVTQLIARRVREAGVYCEIHPFSKAGEAFTRLKPKAAIFSGGPASVPEAGSPRAPAEIFGAGFPFSPSATASRPCASNSAARWRAAMRRNSAVRKSKSSLLAPCSTASGKRAAAIRCG